MKTIKTALAASVLLTIVGCQSTPDQPREIATTTKQEQKKDNSYEQYENAKAQYESWLAKLKDAEELKLYSKSLYRELLSAWDEAVDIYEDIAVDPSKTTESYSLFSSGTYAENFDKRLTVVETNYNQLLTLKETADEVLSDAQAQMAYLDEIDAIKMYPSQYKLIYGSYRSLYTHVESGDLDDAQTKQVTFLTKAKQLEMKVMIKRYVAPLKKKLKDLRMEEFDDVAAISYAKAKAEIDATEQTIRSNPRDMEAIGSAVEDAEFELAHVRSVALEVKRLASVEDDEFEPVVLEFENKLLAISEELDGADYRDQSLRVQAESILESISKLHEEKDEASSSRSAELAGLKEELTKLKVELELKAEEQAKTEEEKSALEKKVSQLEVQVASQQTLLSAYQQQLKDKAAAESAEPEEKAVSDEEAAEAASVQPQPEAEKVEEVSTATENTSA